MLLGCVMSTPSTSNFVCGYINYHSLRYIFTLIRPHCGGRGRFSAFLASLPALIGSDVPPLMNIPAYGPFLSLCSYDTALIGKGRLNQPDNPEIQLTSTTGLLYLGAIAQLKNVTEQLEECTYNVEGCAIKLCSRTIPSPSDYNLATEAKYAKFTIAAEPLPSKQG